ARDAVGTRPAAVASADEVPEGGPERRHRGVCRRRTADRRETGLAGSASNGELAHQPARNIVNGPRPGTSCRVPHKRLLVRLERETRDFARNENRRPARAGPRGAGLAVRASVCVVAGRTVGVPCGRDGDAVLHVLTSAAVSDTAVVGEGPG